MPRTPHSNSDPEGASRPPPKGDAKGAPGYGYAMFPLEDVELGIYEDEINLTILR